MANTDVTFPAPEGFTVPENLEGDGTFQAMATFRLIDDSTLQLVDVEGYQVGDEDTEGDTNASQTANAANAQAAIQGAAQAQNGGSAASADDQGPPAAPSGTQASFANQMAQRFKQATGRR
jgi:hypothetical protein